MSDFLSAHVVGLAFQTTVLGQTSLLTGQHTNDGQVPNLHLAGGSVSRVIRFTFIPTRKLTNK